MSASTSMPKEISALMGMTAYVSSLSSRDAFGKETGAGVERAIACYYTTGTSTVLDQQGKQLPVSITLYTNDISIVVTDHIRIGTATYRIGNVSTHLNEKGLVWGQEVSLL